MTLVYVLIVLGWVIPFGYTIPVTRSIFHLILLVTGLSNYSVLLTIFNPVLTLVDIGIAIFGPWLWTLGFRRLQGRQALARTGKRTLVIGDAPWVHQLLESYVSKLFSLSYGIVSLDVHGANPQDEMLHNFGHRVVRGTLVLLGVPDGRRSQMQKKDEDAAIMTAKQADGVRHFGVGPEVIALGHNPAIAQKGFSDAIVLESKTSSLLKEEALLDQQAVIEELREARFSSFERLLASYVLFWAFAKNVASFPLLRYQYWKSQSRTRIATTAAPVSGISVGLPKVKPAPTQALSAVMAQSAVMAHRPSHQHYLPTAPDTQETADRSTSIGGSLADTSVNRSIDPAFIDRCQQELAYCIGPIATLIVKEMLTYAPPQSSHQLVEALAKKIPDLEEAQEFRQRLASAQ